MSDLAERLRQLAERYENKEFLNCDPSRLMHRYGSPQDQEIAGLVAAVLAFGRRSQILQHIDSFVGFMKGESPAEWISSGKYLDFLPDTTNSFYRVFSFRNLRRMCDVLRQILQEYGSLGNCFRKEYENGGCGKYPGRLAEMIVAHFPEECSPLISHGKNSANKRMNLFLRWMVRDDSPVDLGLWGWYPKSELLMPLDTHVVAMAKKFGFLKENGGATLKQALILTDAMAEIFPDDPTKGDFALFGYGVDNN